MYEKEGGFTVKDIVDNIYAEYKSKFYTGNNKWNPDIRDYVIESITYDSDNNLITMFIGW